MLEFVPLIELFAPMLIWALVCSETARAAIVMPKAIILFRAFMLMISLFLLVSLLPWKYSIRENGDETSRRFDFAARFDGSELFEFAKADIS